MTTVECGAACLAMVLCYFGRPTTVAETREACVVGRDGLRASTIAQAARRFGLAVRAYSSDLPSLKDVALPAIIHWELSHYVVLERWDERGAAIVDPAQGRRLIPKAEFGERFTGVVLTFQTTEKLLPNQTRVRQRAWPMQMISLSGETPNAIPVAIIAVLMRVLSFTVPWLLWVVFDGAIGYRSVGLMWVASGIAILLFCVRGLMMKALSGLVRAGNLSKDLAGQEQFVSHLFRLPLQFFQQRSSGDLLMRAQSALQVADSGGQLVADLADGVCCTAMVVVLAVWLPWFALMLLLLSAAGLLGAAVQTERRQRLAQETMRRTSQQQGYLLEALRGAMSLKASALEQNAIERWKSLLSAQLNVTIRAATLADRGRLFEVTLSQMTSVVFLLMSTSAVLSGKMTIGLAAGAGTACLGPLHQTSKIVR